MSRSTPKPFTLKGESPLENPTDVVDLAAGYCGDGSSRVARPGRLEDGTALELARLMELGKSHGVKYLTAMQCNNIAFPLGQGLWEGVPLQELIRPVGEVDDVRRITLGVPQRRPGPALPVLAFLQAGEGDASLGTATAGGLSAQWPRDPPEARRPVRRVVPSAHGFKSIK